VARRLRELADFIDGSVSGQRYGQHGSPYLNTTPLREAADLLTAKTPKSGGKKKR
jgi:hypothetical protein